MTALGERRACGTLLHLGSERLGARRGAPRVETFLNLANRSLVLALCRGAIEEKAPLLARVHSSCMTSETFGGCDCDCAGQLEAALDAVRAAGRGVVFYLMQEGRGAGFVAKARDRMMVQASRDRVTTFDAYARMGLGRDYRRYDDVAFAAAALGIGAPLTLLTNNPDKVAALRRANVRIQAVRPLERAPSPFNLHYLAAKSRSGHALTDPVRHAVAAAALPEAVEYFDPHPLPERPRFVRMASYLLPIRRLRARTRVHWLRLHAYFDLATHRERILFTLRRDPTAVPLVRIERESLLARFPGGRRSQRTGWRHAVERLAARGAGCALFLLHDDPLARPDGPGVAADDDLAWLLAAHVAAPRAEMLLDGNDGDAAAEPLRGRLARHGVVLDAS